MRVPLFDKNGDRYAAAYAPCCREILVSTHRHDFSGCSCGKSFVDGGSSYVRAGGSLLPLSEIK